MTRHFSVSARLATILLCAVPPCLHAQAAPGSSSRADSAAVIGVAEDLLHAISTRDTVLARRVLLPGAQLVSIADPATPTAAGRAQNDQQFVTSLASGTARYLERMWNPTVFVHGPLAVVRAPYDFFVDGALSHCGVDVFTMVRSRGEWRVSHVVYTTQRTECAPSPLGPPKGN